MMIETSTEIVKLTTALFSAQGQMEAVAKDGKNEAFKRNNKASSYATLEAVIDAAKPALQANGLAFVQAPGAVVDGALEMTTMLVHGASGQWMRFTLHVPLQQKTAQGVGSAITYARRYSLMSVLGLPAEDDDGNEASKPAPQQQTKQPANAKPAKSNDNPFDAEPDPAAFKDEHDELVYMTTQCMSVAELEDLFKSARVKDFRAHAPKRMDENLVLFAKTRKAELTSKKEAA